MMERRNVISVLFGAALAGIGWAIWWPSDELLPDSEPEVVRVESRREVRRTSDLRERFRRAVTDEEKLALAREAAELSPVELEKLLTEGGAPSKDFGSTVLLIAWGRVDPVAALEWVWGKRERWGLRRWEEAWKAVGPEWAINDSEGFFQYVVDHLPEGEENYYNQSTAMDAPLLQFGVEFEWLLRGDAQTFIKAWHRYSRWGSGVDEDFVKSLEDAEEYEVVLSTWDEMSPETAAIYEEGIEEERKKLEGVAEDDPGYGRLRENLDRKIWSTERRLNPRKNSMAQDIIRRWVEEDPEGFAESRFSKWGR